MAHINDELGIPVLNTFEDLVSIGSYENASGRKAARQQKRAERKKERVERRVDRKEARQERRQMRREARDTQRVTTGDRNAAEQWVITSFKTNLLEAKDFDTLEYWIGVMADQKANLEEMLGKRKSGVGRVLSFGRQYKRRGKNAGLCTSDECIRTSQARLDALNQFEMQHKTAIDALRKKFEKSQTQLLPPSTEKTETGGATLPPTPSNIGTGMATTIETATTTTDGTTTAGSTSTDKDKQKNMILWGVGGLAVVGVIYALVRKGQ